jgi:hypothetical protein
MPLLNLGFVDKDIDQLLVKNPGNALLLVFAVDD